MADFTLTMELVSNAKSVSKCAAQDTNFTCMSDRTLQVARTVACDLTHGRNFKVTFNLAREKMEFKGFQNVPSRRKKNDVHSNANFVTEAI